MRADVEGCQNIGQTGVRLPNTRTSTSSPRIKAATAAACSVVGSLYLSRMTALRTAICMSVAEVRKCGQLSDFLIS